jgi:hypothetical protein
MGVRSVMPLPVLSKERPDRARRAPGGRAVARERRRTERPPWCRHSPAQCAQPSGTLAEARAAPISMPQTLSCLGQRARTSPDQAAMIASSEGPMPARRVSTSADTPRAMRGENGVTPANCRATDRQSSTNVWQRAAVDGSSGGACRASATRSAAGSPGRDRSGKCSWNRLNGHIASRLSSSGVQAASDLRTVSANAKRGSSTSDGSRLKRRNCRFRSAMSRRITGPSRLPRGAGSGLWSEGD